MKHKKAVLITISFFASCAVAYGIGQGIVVPMTEKNQAKTEGTVNTENSEENVNNNETTVNDGSVLFRFVDGFDTLTFEGKETVSTSDIPWGSTIAKIEEETLGTSIMMTPNTYMTASYHVSGKETLQWKYAIHPWVRANSDGLTMHVRVYTTDMENAELSEDYTVDASADYQSMQLSLEQFEGQDVKITFSVGNGANNDSNGDWLVLNELCVTTLDMGGQKQNEVKLFGESTNDEEKIELETDGNFTLAKVGTVSGNVPFSIKEYVEEPVLTRGADGEWDSVDVLNPSVIVFNDMYYNYYSGYDGEEWHTGVAVSEDGVTWNKYEKNPVLSTSEEGWDSSYIAANGSAIVVDGKVYYYYQGSDENGTARIGLAISEDGYNFTKQENYIIDVGTDSTWDCSAVADPYVIEHKGKYYMYYLGANEVDVQRLGVAVSEDGIYWIKSSRNAILDVGVTGTFDENGLGEPSVYYQAPYFYMLYTGRSESEQRNIGLAISVDGVNWEKQNTEGLFTGNTAWNSQVICDTTFLYNEKEDCLNVWYGGGNVASPDENLNGSVGLFKVDISQNRDLYKFVPEDMVKSVIDVKDVYNGSYGVEEDGNVWVDADSIITLKNEANMDRIVVTAYIPLEMHQKTGVDSLMIDVYLEGKKVGTYNCEEAGIVTMEIPKNDAQDDEWLELELRANHSVNQKKEGIGEDARDLAFVVQKIVQE